MVRSQFGWRFVLVAALVGGAGAMVWAQQASAPAPESMAALTAEVRALRVSIEAAAKDQQQVQGLGVYLSVQKDRLLQVVARHDSAKREVADTVERLREAQSRLAVAERQSGDQTLPAEIKAELAGALPRMRAEIERIRQAEFDARNRESLAEQAVGAEEARWNDLVARLEASIRR